MALGTTTAKDVIFRALRMTAICFPNEIPSLNYIQTGIELLNEALDDYSSSSLYIPYKKTLTFPIVNGKATYTIGTLPTNDIITTAEVITLLTATFNFGTPNSQIIPLPIFLPEEIEYYSRLQKFSQIPSGIIFNRDSENCTLTLYPIPPSGTGNSTITINFKQAFLNVEANTVMIDCPYWYLKFLRYDLAPELVGEYQIGQWTAEQEEERKQLRQKVKSANYVLKAAVPKRDAPRGNLGWGGGIWGGRGIRGGMF